MGNFVGYVEPLRFDGLSDRANKFINDNKETWQRFIMKFKRAAKYRNQKIMDEAIEILRPTLNKFNPNEGEWDGKSKLDGEEIWLELWEWLIKNNNKEEEE